MGILASLIAGLASGETVAALHRAKTAAMVYAIACIVAATGVGFLIAAAFIFAARRYGSVEAALGFGVGFLLVAGIVLLAHRLTARAHVRRQERRRKSDLTALGVTATAALLPMLAKARPGRGMILGPLAAIAAYAIYRENRRSPQTVKDRSTRP